MASIDTSGLDELVSRLEKFGDQAFIENTAKKAVDAAAPICADAMRTALSSVEIGPYATGSISASIQKTDARVNAYGVFAVARPTGRDEKGLRNAEKAAYLQYGTPNMRARPWRQKAVNIAKGPAIKTMEDTMKAEMELD